MSNTYDYNTKTLILGTVLLIGIFIASIASSIVEPQIVKDIKVGKVSLECQFSDGWRNIPKEKFVGIDDVNGYYLFTNGSAKNCQTY